MEKSKFKWFKVMKNKPENKNSKNSFSSFIKISLIIHLILLILFLLFAFKYSDIKKINPKQPQKFKIKRQAKLSPRKSEHGIATFTEQQAQFKKPKSKTVGAEKQKGGVSEKKAFQKAELPKEINIKKETKPKPKKKSRVRIKRPPVKKQKEKKLINDLKINENKKKTVNEEKGKFEIKKIEINQAETKTAPPKIEKLKTFGIDEKNLIPDIKPKKSIIGMTTGFIENLKHKGNDWLERDGDKNVRPDYEDLKYISLIWVFG